MSLHSLFIIYLDLRKLLLNKERKAILQQWEDDGSWKTIGKIINKIKIKKTIRLNIVGEKGCISLNNEDLLRKQVGNFRILFNDNYESEIEFEAILKKKLYARFTTLIYFKSQDRALYMAGCGYKI